MNVIITRAASVKDLNNPPYAKAVVENANTSTPVVRSIRDSACAQCHIPEGEKAVHAGEILRLLKISNGQAFNVFQPERGYAYAASY